MVNPFREDDPTEVKLQKTLDAYRRALERANALQDIIDRATDITPRDSYEKTCAYCGRPAESTYG